MKKLFVCAAIVSTYVSGVSVSSASTIPDCPPVYYDGVTPPSWSTPDGNPPNYDCKGDGHVDIPRVLGETVVDYTPDVEITAVASVVVNPAFTG